MKWILIIRQAPNQKHAIWLIAFCFSSIKIVSMIRDCSFACALSSLRRHVFGVLIILLATAPSRFTMDFNRGPWIIV
jgi:hypothetical protein